MSRVYGINELPGCPVGERIYLLPDPPAEETEGGIKIPQTSMTKPFTGKVVDAGLQAMDRLYDHGVEIGDTVWWGKFAGVIEEWDHLTKEGTKPCDEHSWDRRKAPRVLTHAFACSCGAERIVESLIVANVDDCLNSIELADRRRTGKVRYARGVNKETGATQFYIQREGAE